MAKYTINHTCGHSREIQLFGKSAERERKIEWMESQECPQCWGAKKREAEAKLPIMATVKINGLDTDTDGNILIEIILSGGTASKKEEIKQIGFRWGEVRGGVMDMFSVSRPQQAWIKRISWSEENLKGVQEQLKALNAQCKMDINPIDIKFAQDKLAAKKSQDEKVKKITKPEKPECLPSNRGKWNGKVYGNEKYGYRVYVDNIEEKLLKQEAEEIKAYLIAREKYNVEVDKIKAGETNA